MMEPDASKRSFVKRGVYAAPAILTLMAAPEFAKAGSVKPHDRHPGPHGHPDKPGPKRP